MQAYQPLPQLRAQAGLLSQQHVHSECWDQCQGHCEAVIQWSSKLQTPLPFVTIIQRSFSEPSHVKSTPSCPHPLLDIWSAIKAVSPRRCHVTPTLLALHFVFNLPLQVCKEMYKTVLGKIVSLKGTLKGVWNIFIYMELKKLPEKWHPLDTLGVHCKVHSLQRRAHHILLSW